MATWTATTKTGGVATDFLFSDSTDFLFSDGTDYVFKEAEAAITWSTASKNSATMTAISKT